MGERQPLASERALRIATAEIIISPKENKNYEYYAEMLYTQGDLLIFPLFPQGLFSLFFVFEVFQK